MIPKYELTPNQIAYIKQNWNKKSIHYMAKLFHCSWYAIAREYSILGLELPKSGHSHWTVEEDNYLKENAHNLSLKELSSHLHKSIGSVNTHCNVLGIYFEQWSSKEDQYLKENWGYTTMNTLSRNLNRTPMAITSRVQKLNLGPAFHHQLDYILINDVAKILNVSRDKVLKTWPKQGLVLHRITISNKKWCYGIALEDLLSFLESHQNSFNARYVEKNILGIEPEWLIEKRKQDFQTFKSNNNMWTLQETKLLLEMIRHNKSYQEISTTLNRSLSSIYSRVYSLKKTYSNNRYYTEQDIKILQENYQNGYPLSYDELATKLNKSHNSIIQKCEHLQISLKKSKNK